MKNGKPGESKEKLKQPNKGTQHRDNFSPLRHGQTATRTTATSMYCCYYLYVLKESIIENECQTLLVLEIYVLQST